MTTVEDTKRAQQLAFNGAWRGLKSQGFKRCINKDGCCVYDDGKGNHCGIGWLFKPDQMPKSNGPICIPEFRKGLEPTFDQFWVDVPSAAFLQDLQSCHDNAATPTQMQAALCTLANSYSLTIPDGD